MSIAAVLEGDRADRFPLDRSGTMRRIADAPNTVMVGDISQTGCLIRSPFQLELGDRITLGIAGIGVIEAEISRSDTPFYGCAFTQPISQARLAAGIANGSATLVRFPLAPSIAFTPDESANDVDDQQFEHRFTIRARAGMIFGLAAVAWILPGSVAFGIWRLFA